MRENLKGRVAVITGGSGVLCSRFAKELAKVGVKVAILGLVQEECDQVAQEIKNDGGEAIGIACNVMDKASMEAAEAKVSEVYGPCNILINGAGGNSPRGTTTKEVLSFDDLKNKSAGNYTFFDIPAKDLESVFSLNCTGTMLTTQIFAPKMVGREGAVILNISSMNAYRPLTKIPAYSAAKAAVSNFTQWLAVYLADVGIRVNAIAPGFFETAQNAKLLRNPDGSLTERSHKILNHTPMKRFGKPEDLIGTLMYLCDEQESGFVTGVVIPVDGGFSAYSGV
ncbi:putative oxidoreductase UxuB [[Clostridium] cellulosi]|uniref:Putative oxidoreductase UxuB n=1 Tax=[Clostridium] cellulosi TaxID=29343 RepID=A0A078KRD8_9FIRM|nr:putative oxidoreductase UxuB [[Clostridium] cellulosi]